MARTLKRALDLELDMIVGTLIKKGLEAGSFIGVHVNELLDALCESCSENRIASAFLSVLGAQKSLTSIANPAPPIKLRAIGCFERLILRLGNKLLSFKDNEKIISVLALFLSEGSLEVRSAAKRAILCASNKVMSPIDFDRLLQRALSEANYSKVKTFLSKEGGDSPLMQGTGKGHILSNKRLKLGGKEMTTKAGEGGDAVPATKPSAHGSPVVKQGGKAKAPLLPSEEPPEFENLATLTTTINNSSNWKSRVDAIDGLMEIAEKFTDALSRSGKFIAVLDSLAKSLNDTNVKVSIKAVGALERFVPLFKTNIELNVMLLLNYLANNLCSSNATLKNKADILIDLLIDTVENVCLVQPFVHISLYGNARAKPGIILHLCGN